MKALQLGRYHLLDRIAFGGMAEIYRAKTFDEHGRVHMVAVKRILSHLGRDEEFIRMLVDEARIASLMQHENIAKTFEFCHAQGEYFIVMEYVDGKDGRTLLDRCRAQRRWIPPELCAFIMMHTLRALDCAHNQMDRDGRPLNLIHRDVSPSNVICSYSGEVKLCDFGIAKATLSRVQTRSGVIKGKVKYMSPEQAMGRRLDPRSDIFSAGSVLYEFLTKVPPFLAPNEMELLVLVRESRYQGVRERNPMVPPALEAIVDTAMSRSLDDRYRTAAKFADALEQYLRIHAPRITRSHLGQFVRNLFDDDIERELRALEEYVVEDQGTEEVGVNLIAEDLPAGAAFEKFSATQAARRAQGQDTGDMTPQEVERGEIEVAERQPPGDDPGLGHSPTVILESSDLLSVAGAGGPHRPQEETEILWSRDEVVGESSAPARGETSDEESGPAEEAPSEDDYRYGAIDPHLAAMVLAQEGLHDARTVILDIDDEESEASDQPETGRGGQAVEGPGGSAGASRHPGAAPGEWPPAAPPARPPSGPGGWAPGPGASRAMAASGPGPWPPGAAGGQVPPGPGQWPPGAPPAGQVPPGPGQWPPGAPAGQVPPGPGQWPPGAPAGQVPPGPGQWPPGAPAGHGPPGPGQWPPGPGQWPPGASPAGHGPPGPGQWPPGAPPAGHGPPGPGQWPPGAPAGHPARPYHGQAPMGPGARPPGYPTLPGVPPAGGRPPGVPAGSGPQSLAPRPPGEPVGPGSPGEGVPPRPAQGPVGPVAGRPAPEGFRYVHTLSGPGARSDAATTAHHGEDLHDLPTGQIEPTGRSWAGVAPESRHEEPADPPSTEGEDFQREAEPSTAAGSDGEEAQPGSLETDRRDPTGLTGGMTDEVSLADHGTSRTELGEGTAQVGLTEEPRDPHREGQGIPGGKAPPRDTRPGTDSHAGERETSEVALGPEDSGWGESSWEADRGTDEIALPEEPQEPGAPPTGDSHSG